MWSEVCDSLGACTVSPPTLVEISPGETRTIDALIEDARALVLRCEIGWLQRLSVSTIVTYAVSFVIVIYQSKYKSTIIDF